MRNKIGCVDILLHPNYYVGFMKKRSEREVRLLLYRSRKKMARPNCRFRETSNSSTFHKVKCRFGKEEFDAYGIPIDPPENFSLVNNSSGVLLFLEKFRKYYYPKPAQHLPNYRGGQSRSIGYYVNFSRMHNISTAAALVLAAEFYRLKGILSKNPKQKTSRLGLVDFHKWKKQSIWTLYNLGFLELLEVDLQDYELKGTDESDRRIQKFMSGKHLDTSSIIELKEGLAKLTTKLDTEKEIKLGIYDGLCEAMTNTKDHAYQYADKHLKLPYLEGQWWMTGSVTNCGTEIEVVFFDQGISIPCHLPQTSAEYLRAYFKSQGRDDAMMIKAAMAISRSSLKQEKHRGQGLPQIKDLINLSQKGKLRILSRKGEYIYEYEKGKAPKEKTQNLVGDIGGTLVHWHLIVKSV